MKNFVSLFTLSIIMVLFVGINDADAQRRGSKEVEDYFDESGGFEHRLWYGGNVGFGINASQFYITLEPMVGYKITDFFSVGPRLSYQYRSIKETSGSATTTYKGSSYGAGVFTRVKFLQSVFLHAEYMALSKGSPYDPVTGYSSRDPNKPNRFVTYRYGDSELNIGAGYSSGGIIAYEIMLYYNVLIGDDSNIIPWGFRFGFTYKF